MSGRVQIDPMKAFSEFAEFNRKVMQGAPLLQKTKGDDVQIATSPKEEVFRTDKTVLYHYDPIVPREVEIPVLVVFGLVGRYTFIDLQEDRSLTRNLLKQGIDLYVVDWGTPTRGDQWLALEDYVDGYLSDCVEFICRKHKVPAITLLGICEGGTFSLCYAARQPKRVRNLILTITPVDFHPDTKGSPLHHGLINSWTRSMSGDDIDLLIKAYGNLPGDLMSFLFSMMAPMNNLTKYNVGLFDVMDDENKLLNYLRMEKWLSDRPDHPGAAARQWLKDLYQENRLVKGEFMLGGEVVNLRKVTMPVLNVYAQDDHIVPPKSTQPLKDRAGTKDYTALPLPGGHIGVFVSGKSQGILGKGIADWLKKR
jgi:polyhydroxyalkanoate synthase subunit PhaC